MDRKLRKKNQYLVAKSHDCSVGLWPKLLLIGSSIDAKHNKPQQQHWQRPLRSRLHCCFPVKKTNRSCEFILATN